MTDELVKRLRSANDESFVETLCGEAADRIEALTADRENRLADLRIIKAERDRLREAAIALRDDMLERSRAGMDVIHGKEYRIVNAGAGVWMDFCAALKGETP
tara:strand:+ start:469 stop:777 length:309 start_codon:yes stop_codon:yes gene_type:complete